MDYKQKYLKYKTKYLQLKEQSGGFNSISQGYNWMKKKASDKYDCFMKGHSRICNGLLDEYLNNIHLGDDKLKIALQKVYKTLVEEHNNNVYETATDEDYNQKTIDTPISQRKWKQTVDSMKILYEQFQRKKITLGDFYDYLAKCINQKCVSIDWNKYPGLIDFLESPICLNEAGREYKTLKVSDDDRNKNHNKAYNRNNSTEETKEENNINTTKENNINTTKENNDTKEENNVLSEKQLNDIRTKGFSEGPEPDVFYFGGFSDLNNWYHGTCNEIHEKINAIYQKYLSESGKNNPDSLMGGEFTRIRTKYFNQEKEKMTQDEIDIYNEIKQYNFNWNKYKKKLEEKNFCKEKK